MQLDCISDFEVSMSASDEFFIKFRPYYNIYIMQSPPTNSISSTSSSNILSERNFSFLGEEHTKLLNMTDACFAAYVSKCELESKKKLKKQKSKGLDRGKNERSLKRLISMFYSGITPDITTRQYVGRLVKYLQIPSYVYIVAFIYLENLNSREPKNIFNLLLLTEDNMHRLLITAIFIAARILTPGMNQVTEIHFSKVAGTKSSNEISRLVSAFHVLSGANYTVKKSTFKNMMQRMEI